MPVLNERCRRVSHVGQELQLLPMCTVGPKIPPPVS
jgi:hypothetical protein